jgi:hypothetical protein
MAGEQARRRRRWTADDPESGGAAAARPAGEREKRVGENETGERAWKGIRLTPSP